ncbi:Transposon TX1 uncharacterized 149 kDa protein [Vitis vinifera]|uniref:Transposon TX1 uncharacterized 149 kDa protein n=1 Tax=Vitis vinifera TaxID=29760 RepID=A0A438CQI2_VITVI|nr:Transposon TX1 uncharacterized 149 kDa protein [Vitis vinifera]
MPEIRGKGLNFKGNCGLLVAENLEVISSSPTQSPSSSLPPSCDLASSFLSPSVPNLPSQISVGIPNLVVEEIQPAYPYQLTESVNPILSKPILPNKVSNLVIVSQGVTAGFPLGEFQIEGLSPKKMAKVREVLKSLDIKGFGFKEKAKDGQRFSEVKKPDVVMIQETKKAECDRRLKLIPISGESASRLDSPFTEEEISKAIFQLDRDKASGPNGFTIAVFQDCWDVIKEDLVRMFAEFHKNRIINQSTNASFIVLLPKKSMSKKISDYRPISLITSLYKIIVKVLSGRLRGVLHETIHSTQGAFVQGRQILNAVLIANEIVDEKR